MPKFNLKTAAKNAKSWWLSQSRWFQIGFPILILVLFIGSAAGAYSYNRYKQIVVKATPPAGLNQNLPSPTADPDRPISILIMGYGGGGHQGGKLTDTMMLMYIQPKLQTIHLMSIPRDVWVSLPIVDGAEPTSWKINAAYALGSDDNNYRRKPVQYTGPAGGGELAKYAVKQALGVDVDYFAVVNFASFKKAIDTLGGVDVKVDITFDDYEYPIDGLETDPCGKSEEEIAAITATMSADLAPTAFTCRYEHLHFDRGVTHMDGETALKFVRSRHSAQDGNDFGRANRQRNLILAVRDKVLSINFIPKVIPFLSSLATDFQTDIDFSDMQKFLDKQSEYSKYTIVSVPITDKNGVLRAGRSANGQYVILPVAGEGNWGPMHDWVKTSLMATQSASASGTVKPL